MNWSFATVNGKFAEIYFDRDDKNKVVTMLGHAYVDKDNFITEKEKMYIAYDLPDGWKLVTGDFED